MDEELEIKAYYAGHVLGAAMFQIKVGSESVVYTVSQLEARAEGGRGVGQREAGVGGTCGRTQRKPFCLLQGDYNMTPDRHLG